MKTTLSSIKRWNHGPEVSISLNEADRSRRPSWDGSAEAPEGPPRVFPRKAPERRLI
ncbi:hypothetical protein J2Y66_002481 [Paenarthrobacter nitroguajacolicus]|uniref:hypothetical protein n=1 Tax=Paenarthrobacter TaxID=1742992 RepID=UPI002865D2D5|nr:hypothetical protein [Paenarthrobacter nitroguajacolicus]MDR6987983.1 hypothetical protein [Paenarthrobacter nitroguajacolicus]